MKLKTIDYAFRMLNNNKLTTLGKEMFNGLSHLKTLKLSDNTFDCDCHLAWLSRYLKNYPRLGQHTRCSTPTHLRGQNINDLQVIICECDSHDSLFMKLLRMHEKK